MTSAKISTIFRVTGLTTTQPADVLDAELKTTIHGNLLEEERTVIKITTVVLPSCYDEESERVALVEFCGRVPDFLSELVANPLGDWQVEMDDDNDISFDRHFFGFTQLYSPKPDVPIAADIIAITGLDGHAYDAWRGKGNLGRMWLRDFLSKDLPYCRTMTYGYNSKLSSHGIDTIMDYGRELMEEIKKIRSGENLRQRPLFFIAHSFGGIILAHCLIKAVQTSEGDHPTIASLYKATHGIILFATPHKGLLINDIQKMLAGQEKHPRNTLLQQISHKSDLLMSQLADFKNLIRDRKVVSFYETEQTRQLELDSESGHWERTGDPVTTVDIDSALLQLPDHIEDKIPLHADHSMIVKFDNKNTLGYRSALDRLKRFEKDAPRVVAARFSQAQNKPKPSSTVPFQRDSMFVGREDIIKNICQRHEQAASQNHSRVALVGLGGVGKSQIAIEYAYRVRELESQMWVFWVHASNAVRFEQAYRNIAAKVELPGRDDPKTEILPLVYNWLCDERNGRWLMILDNADDDDFFFCSEREIRATGQASSAFSETIPLASFLPQTPNGWILVTSRNLLAATNLVGAQHDGSIIRVDPMNAEDAVALLQTRFAVGAFFQHESKALIQALDCIPLAITQAAAYIRMREMTFSTYLDLFYESEANQAHILKNEEARDLRRDPSVPHAVITTWQISFEQIRKTQPSATDLLALMSMFDPQGIPEDLLRDGTNRLHFEDAVAPLTSFSLVRTRTRQQMEKKSFEMHRLVQFSMRKWLEFNQQLDKWRKVSLRNVARAFPSGEYETWATCEVLLPHSKTVLTYLPNIEDKDDIDILNVAKLGTRTANYLLRRGKYALAETFGQIGVEGFKTVLGPEHPQTLMSANYLSSVLSHRGKLEEAEMRLRQALKVEEKALGREHPSTCFSLNDLGIVLVQQGKDEEAEAMFRRALELNENKLGREHLRTLSSFDNPGSVSESQGKDGETETLYRLASEASEKHSGRANSNKVTIVSNLASALNGQGKYEEAEAMYRRALEGSEKEHPGKLQIVINLGSSLEFQGKYEEAEAMYRRALEGCEKMLGREHPITLTSVTGLGTVLIKQGKYEEAEAMHRRVLKEREKNLGQEHPGTLISFDNLGSALHDQGKHEEAEAMHRRALEGNEKMLGREHPSTLISVNNVGSVLQSQGKYQEAEAMYRRSLEGCMKKLGREHPITLNRLNNLGSVLQDQGKYEEAEAMYRRSIEGRMKKPGQEHPYTLAIFINLGSLLRSQRRYEEAEAMFRRALEAYEKKHGREHQNTLQACSNLGAVLEDQGKYEEAEAMHRRSLEGCEKDLGLEHPDTLINVHNLSFTLDIQGKYEEAEAMFRRALEGREKTLGREHPSTRSCFNSLSSFFERQGRYQEWEAMHVRQMELEGVEKELQQVALSYGRAVFKKR